MPPPGTGSTGDDGLPRRARRPRRGPRCGPEVDAIGYVGAGSMALAPPDVLDDLLSPVPGEVVANNRFSTDAFVVAASPPEGRPAPDGTTRHGPDLDRALDRLDACPTDNTAARCLESAGFRSRDLASRPWTRFDVDTPLDLALLRLAARLPAVRLAPGPGLAGFLEMARLPGDRDLDGARPGGGRRGDARPVRPAGRRRPSPVGGARRAGGRHCLPRARLRRGARHAGCP